MPETQFLTSTNVWLLLLTAGLVMVIIWLYQRNKILRSKNQQLSEEKKALRRKLNNVRIDYIETKLSPHLFKNILNSVQSHAYQTYNSLDKLSGVLDYILYESSEKYVTPQSEFDFTVNLIEINKIKMNPLFNFQLKSQIDKEDPVYSEKVLAPLITVDFVENAFKHTDFIGENSFIFIYLSLKKGILEAKVQNHISAKSPLAKKNSGFGSESLEHRLKILYKNNFKITKEINGNIYTAYLKIDLNDKYNQVRYTR